MLIFSRIALGLALLLASIGDLLAQSQQHPPANQAPKAEQSAPQDQRGTKDQPFTVNVIPTTEQQAEAEKEAAEAQRKGARDEKLINYTEDLVLVGIVQFAVFVLQFIAFVVQAIYIRISAKEMRKTTKAAEDVAKDQIAHSHQIERAYISGGGVQETRFSIVNMPISSEPFAQTIPHAQGVELTGRFEIHINNHGKTPGRLMLIAIDFCDAGNIPPVPTYHPEAFQDWIGPGTQSRPILWRIIPTNRPASAIYGRFYYQDIFGNDHSSGFIQSIRPDGTTWPILASAPYNASN